MVIEDSYVECPHCKTCQKKQDVIDNDGYCFDCENKIRKGLLKMKEVIK